MIGVGLARHAGRLASRTRWLLWMLWRRVSWVKGRCDARSGRVFLVQIDGDVETVGQLLGNLELLAQRVEVSIGELRHALVHSCRSRLVVGDLHTLVVDERAQV